MATKPKQSTQFRFLNRNLNRIKKIFISMKVRSDGTYTEREQAMASAYGLLAHAEIEYYFETVAEEVVLNAYKKWESDKKPSHVLMSLAIFMDIKEEIPEIISKGTIDKDKEGLIEKRLEVYVKKYMGILGKNNGIKEINLLKMLLPLGIHLNEIDTTFLSSMNSFGHDRGEIAHNSIKTQILIDPFTKEKDVINILKAIKDLDTKIISLK